MKKNFGELIRLGINDRDAAAAVLARAFSEYDLLRYYFPDEKQRHAIARTFCFIQIAVCIRYGEAYASSENMEGIAGWLPPGTAPFGGREVLRSVSLRILLKYVLQGASRMKSYNTYLDELHRRLLPERHWYLHILGIDPDCQGQGYSSRLLRPMLERIDREGLRCFVETHDPKNTDIYGRFGFETVSEMTIPRTELTSYGMIREAVKGDIAIC